MRIDDNVLTALIKVIQITFFKIFMTPLFEDDDLA